jgi:hypothetical protein
MILKEKINSSHTKPSMKEKYYAALANRNVFMGNESPLNTTRKRAISAAEQYAELNWIVGCHSYNIIDNKEYINELAIDSHLSEEIDLDQLF